MLFQKPALLYLLLTFAFFIGSSQICQSQALIAPEPSATADFLAEAGSAAGAILSGEPGSLPADPKSNPQPAPDPDKLKVVIYPILAWAPIMGAHVRVPDTPSTPGGGSRQHQCVVQWRSYVRLHRPESEVVRAKATLCGRA